MRVEGPRAADLNLIEVRNQKHAVEIAAGVIPRDDKEHMIALLLNPKGRVIGWNHIAMGALTSVHAYPREVFLPALTTPGCSALILAHNHPSGDATPSREDLENTEALMKAGMLLGVAVIDHFVVADQTWTSIRNLALAHETKQAYAAAARKKRRTKKSTRPGRRPVQSR